MKPKDQDFPKANDPDALAAFVKSSGAVFYAACWGLRAGEEAAARRTFVDAFKRALEDGTGRPFTACFFSALLRAGSPQATGDPKPMPANEPSQLRRQCVLEALGRLSWEERYVLTLRDALFLSFPEMEAAMGESSASIRKKTNAARSRFLEVVGRLLGEMRGA